MLVITNENIQEYLGQGHLDVGTLHDRIEDTYRHLSEGRAVYSPKAQVSAPLPADYAHAGFLDERFQVGTLQGLDQASGYFALRMKLDVQYRLESTHEKYCIEPGKFCGLVLLVNARNGEPLALMNDGVIQTLRVAATNAVAARYMAREDAEVLGIFGSGGMAHAHARTLARVRNLSRIKVYSPTPAHRLAYASEMQEELGIEVVAVDSPDQLPSECDIIADCTDATIPIFGEDCTAPGIHLTGSGAHFAPAAIERVDAVVLHQVPEASTVIRHSSGTGRISANGSIDPEVHPSRGECIEHPGIRGTLAELVTQGIIGRSTQDEVNLFFNDCGTGIQFAAIAGYVYEVATAQGGVNELPTDLLIQTIRD